MPKNGKATGKALDKANINQLAKQIKGTATIDKQINKETNKQVNKEEKIEKNKITNEESRKILSETIERLEIENIGFSSYLSFLLNSKIKIEEKITVEEAKKIRWVLSEIKESSHLSIDRIRMEWETMIEWYEKNKKTIKDLRAVTRNWMKKLIS